MGDVEQGPSENAPDADPWFVVAALTTALVLATGSALIWAVQRVSESRAQLAPPNQDRKQVSLITSALYSLQLLEASPGEKHNMDGRLQDVPGEHGSESRDAKNVRSKERRKRGKDPLKEMLKGGKRCKGSLKTLKPGSGDADGGAPAGPQIMEGHEGSVWTSSRSSSITSYKSSGKEKDLLLPNESQVPEMASPSQTASLPDDVLSPPFIDNHDDVQPHFPSPHLSFSSEVGYLHDDPPGSFSSHLDLPEGISQPTSSTSYSGSTSDSHSQSTTNTSPPASALSASVSDKPNTTNRSLLVPSKSMPFPSTNRTSAPSSGGRKNSKSPNFRASWQWDSPPNGNNTNSETTYRKPPRFRHKSKNTAAGSTSSIPTSITFNSLPYKHYSPSDLTDLPQPTLDNLPSSSSSGPPESELVFASLNTPSPSPSPGPSSNSNNHQSFDSTNNTPRSAPTPGRTPTPSHDSLTTSVSTQAQLASLSGALEAARSREENSRLEAERLAKECEMLRWKWGEDAGAWRRREAELHAQIQQLVHQIQAYAAVFVSMTGHSPHLQTPLQMSPQNQNSNWPNQGHPYPAPSTSSLPQSPQTLPSTFPFAMYPHSPSIPPPSQNLFSLLFPGNGAGGGGGGGGSTSVSGSSSVGSLSPVLDNSQLWDRGRRKTRARTKAAAEVGHNGGGDEHIGDGWIVSGTDENRVKVEGLLVQDDAVRRAGDREPESDVSPALADAILKRPDSIKARPPALTIRGQQRPDVDSNFASSSNTGRVGAENVVKSHLRLDNRGKGNGAENGIAGRGSEVPDDQQRDGRLDDTSPLVRTGAGIQANSSQ